MNRSNISNVSEFKSDRLKVNKKYATVDSEEGKDNKRWSNMTTYSLPSNFSSDNYSTMTPMDRKRTSVVCQTNAKTLKMATELLEKGTINDKRDKDDINEDGPGVNCMCFVCSTE